MGKDAVLDALEASQGEWISGSTLAESLGVSRAAVWKSIQQLRAKGIDIEAISGGGYRLSTAADLLTVRAVTQGLHTKAVGQNLLILPETASTNTLLKREHADAPHGFTILAESQTAGRGRLGRSFCSPKGGLYCSVLLRLALPLSALHLVTIAAAVAVCDTIEETCGFLPSIKWVNDIHMQGKKLCGILTEASIEGETGTVEFAVLGMGLNLKLDEAMPDELRGIAGALSEFTEVVPHRAVIAASLLNHVEYYCDMLVQGEQGTILQRYCARLGMLGHQITVLGDGEPYDAVAEAVDAEGHLRIRTTAGQEKTLTAGEISIRPQ